tara:strand:- start:74032 stop:74580 length:549 start_codon:yes stop_codon:yes gene_type:complete
MKSMKTGSEILFVLFMVVLGVVSRMMPHPWNFTAIGSMALFSGFSMKSNKYLMIVPFVCLVISDSLIGFYDGMIYTYIGFAVGMLLSVAYFRKQDTFSFGGRVMTLAGLSVVSSFLFFLITNFGVWKGATFYTQDLSGLITCYVAGLPFLFNQIAGDLFYAAIVFGLYEYLTAPSKNARVVA